MSSSEIRPRDEIARLCGEIEFFSTRVANEFDAVRAETISGWSVRQQVEHIALATEHSLRAAALIARGGDERIVPDGEPSAEAAVVLRRERIPRGRAAAPEVALPRESDEGALAAGLARCRELLDHLSDATEAEIAAWTGRIPHPLLGPLSATEWLRFTRIHAEHHHRIIEEIEAAGASDANRR